MTAAARQRLTAEEYLARERAAEYRSEYFDGEIFAMAGASPEHSLIVGNLAAVLVPQLRGRPCRVHPGDLRVKVSETGLYTYPDLLVVCGESRFEDDRRDTLLNPVLVVEVLSRSTEAYDRGAKFAHYASIESLQEYVLVAQDQPRIERFLRQETAGDWLYAPLSGSEATLHLPSIDCRLPLAEAFDKVDFPTSGLPLR